MDANDLLGMSVDGGVDINGDDMPDFIGGAIGTINMPTFE